MLFFLFIRARLDEWSSSSTICTERIANGERRRRNPGQNRSHSSRAPPACTRLRETMPIGVAHSRSAIGNDSIVVNWTQSYNAACVSTHESVIERAARARIFKCKWPSSVVDYISQLRNDTRKASTSSTSFGSDSSPVTHVPTIRMYSHELYEHTLRVYLFIIFFLSLSAKMCHSQSIHLRILFSVLHVFLASASGSFESIVLQFCGLF